MDAPDDGMVIATVTITRVLTDEDIVDHVIATQADGYELGLAEALGMMRLAEDTLIRSRMGDDDADDRAHRQPRRQVLEPARLPRRHRRGPSRTAPARRRG